MENCNHFWEIVFPITGAKKQKHRCMLCGTFTDRELFVLDIELYTLTDYITSQKGIGK